MFENVRVGNYIINKKDYNDTDARIFIPANSEGIITRVHYSDVAPDTVYVEIKYRGDIFPYPLYRPIEKYEIYDYNVIDNPEYTKIFDIIESHKKWLNNHLDPSGDRANLSNMNLFGFNLSNVNLDQAILTGADLEQACLSGANLRRANLTGANLKYSAFYKANLQEANLQDTKCDSAHMNRADLVMADFTRANLRRTDLSGTTLTGTKFIDADLTETDFSCAQLYGAHFNYVETNNTIFNYGTAFFQLQCPEEGSFIGFKAATGQFGSNYLVKLEIPADAKRSSATSRKCRASKVKVLDIEPASKNETTIPAEVRSSFDPNFVYRIGETLEVKNFDEDRWHECAPGIHFFLTRQEAINYANSI